MEEKEKIILEWMKDTSYVPMKAKEMASVLMVPKQEYSKFREVLDGLEEKGKIRRNRKSRYIVEEKETICGIYRATRSGVGFVIPEEGEGKDIFISKDNGRNVLNGDLVLVQIVKEAEKDSHEEGKVIKILKHEKDCLVGTFQIHQNFGFVVPDDKNFGTDIFISKNHFGKARNNHKVLVKITKYPEKGKKAEGKVIEVLGGVYQAGVDMLSLIKEYRLPSVFPESVVEEAKSKGNKVDKKDIPNRRDLRDKPIYTIDGEDAKDLDDAVWVGKNEKGNYLLDVHIADVSYYVQEGSLLDKEAALRGTSIYMLGRVIPMLPSQLSNGICSLNVKEDRFTLSCSMEIDEKGNVVSSDVYKAIIKVKERMTYTNVQKILEGEDEEVLKRYEEDIPQFKLMEELAHILKNRRLEKGYLNLDLPESKITLDENGYAIDVRKYELTFANEIIEQFMLTANETIAEKFFWLEAPFIYRVHEEPDMDKIKELNKVLYNFGYKIKTKDDKVYPKEFAKILEEIKEKPEEKVVSNLILRTLKVAKYEAENKGHFGIASNYYCHFTSPIRRYPDLWIHRMISRYLEKGYQIKEEEKEKYRKEAVESANESSEREKIATKVERDSVDMKKAEYMKKKIGEVYEGIISSVTSFGMFVELENTVEGLIRFENMGNEYFIYDSEHKYLIGEQTKKMYKIGDKVIVQVIDAEPITRTVAMSLVEEEKEEEE